MFFSPRAAAIPALCAWLLLAGPAPAVAQEHVAPPLPVVDLSAGYMFMYDTDIAESFPKGWYFGSAVNLNTWFGVAFEVSGSHKRISAVQFDAFTYMAGPRFFQKTGRLVPFAQFLTGLAHGRAKITPPPEFGYGPFTTSSDNFAIQPGGGVTILLTDHVGLRVATDYRCIMNFDDGVEYTNEFRVTSGMTFHWGAR